MLRQLSLVGMCESEVHFFLVHSAIVYFGNHMSLSERQESEKTEPAIEAGLELLRSTEGVSIGKIMRGVACAVNVTITPQATEKLRTIFEADRTKGVISVHNSDNPLFRPAR
jgi:hypothetical protein